MEEREGAEDPPLLTLNTGEKEEKINPITFLFIPQGAIMQAAVLINVRVTTNEAHNLKTLQNPFPFTET